MNRFTNAHVGAGDSLGDCLDLASGVRGLWSLTTAYRTPRWDHPAYGNRRTKKDDALSDILRLSRGMTCKAALAGSQQARGKSVIGAGPCRGEVTIIMRSVGHFVDTVGGRCVIADDSGTSVQQMRLMRENTAHAKGLLEGVDTQGRRRSSDPSPARGYDTSICECTAVAHRQQHNGVKSPRITLQGADNEGACNAPSEHRKHTSLSARSLC